MYSTYANRGSGLEELITYASTQYERNGIAVIHKVPTPVTVLNNGKGFFKGKSTVDYTGTLKGGRFVCFEAKETKQANVFPLKNIHPHQITYMKNVTNLGGLAFLLVRFVKFKGQGERIFRFQFPELLERWEYYMANEGKRGAASIPAEAFKTEITGECGYILHYLKGLE
jgi:recombination protein U